MYIPYTGNAKQKATSLRTNMTPHERKLWYDFLRSYPVRFNRQKSIGSFISDFYCHRAGIIIELDGSQHYMPEGLSYDEERSQFLESQDLIILRFSNRDVDISFYEVCQVIDSKVKECLRKKI